MHDESVMLGHSASRPYKILMVVVVSLVAAGCGSAGTQYSLATSVVGEGSVLPSAGTFPKGKVVWIEAVPSDGWEFDGWSGDGEGSDPQLLVEVDRDRAVIANFSEIGDPTIMRLTTLMTGSGAVTTSAGSYTRGQVAEVTALPDPGWRFDGWTGSIVSSDPVVAFVIRSDTTLTANFVKTGPSLRGPIIRDVRAVADMRDIVVTFRTSEPAFTTIEHGLTAELSGQPILSSEPTRSHRVEISGYAADDLLWYRVRSTDRDGNETVGALHSVQVPVPGLPRFDLWYGNMQSFGQIGTPQKWVNILGNVSDSDGIDQLFASLGDSNEFPLGIGPDGRRLVDSGDFNVEIDVADLNAGENELTLRAVDGSGNSYSTAVLINWNPSSKSPLPFEAGWSTAGEVSDLAQVVDGDWELTMEGAHTKQVGYDRVLAIGEVSWSNYEVATSIKVHKLDVSGFNPQSNSPAVGVALGWSGHKRKSPTDLSQPRWYFWPTGAFAWYRFTEVGSGEIALTGDQNSASDTDQQFKLVLGIKYSLRAQVSGTDNGVRYRIKMWESTFDEPPRWNAEIVVPDGPKTGALALIAHHVEATFGDVAVTQLP